MKNTNAIHHHNNDADRTTLCGRKETEAVEQDERGWCIACKHEFSQRFVALTKAPKRRSK